MVQIPRHQTLLPNHLLALIVLAVLALLEQDSGSNFQDLSMREGWDGGNKTQVSIRESRIFNLVRTTNESARQLQTSASSAALAQNCSPLCFLTSASLFLTSKAQTLITISTESVFSSPTHPKRDFVYYSDHVEFLPPHHHYAVMFFSLLTRLCYFFSVYGWPWCILRAGRATNANCDQYPHSFI
ncbi:hypothetical protein AZE42_06096 [Rhizopogon vesiculosus]|uniref:Uncharacterized protein n=1 Tax=Rhizopogon vesiculosus TaxID=180088 RepID=A0A1J8PJI9_9AGAM|nr:hypothetical protein AZE42_06096 [Rhizopogon vesiculosus]